MKNLMITAEGVLIGSLILACTSKKETVPQRNTSNGPEISESKTDPQLPEGVFLTPQDFIVSGLTATVTSNDLEVENSFENLWYEVNHSPIDEAAMASFIKDANINFEVRGKDTVVLKIEDRYYYDPNPTADGTLETSSTRTDRFSELYLKKGFSLITCVGVDLSEFQGKPYLGNISKFLSKEIAVKCEAASTIKILDNLSKDDTNDSYKVAFSDTSGKPCELTKNGTSYLLNNCIKRIYTARKIAGKEEKKLIELKAINLTADKTSRWFSSGKYEVKINDFTGEVNYSSSAAAPNYEITKGTEKISGKIPE